MNCIFIDSLVSVIIPVYNSQKTLCRTIDSVLKQTYKNLEVVLVDDCSNDDSVSIIEDFQMKTENIILYKMTKNQGAGVARNKALEIARGQYVAFIDSDDWWDPFKIEKQINLMVAKHVHFCFTAIEMVDCAGNVVKGKRKIKEVVSYNKLLKNTMIATSTVVIDRAYYNDFRLQTRRGGQDYATWLYLLRNGNFAYGINEALCKYTIGNKNSLSGNKIKSIKQVWDIQTKQENINKLRALFNVSAFIFNAFKKYLF